MTKIQYEGWSPGADAIVTVDHADAIVREYAAQGFDLTLRQLYYQFVARALIENTDRSYKRLGATINRARLAGLLDWDAIEDRTRSLRGLSHWDTPGDVVSSAAWSYRRDLWEDQDVYIEVWVEKEALAGVVAQAAQAWDVNYFSCRGYVSQSEQWRAGRRMLGRLQAGKRVIVLHLGDHDPSGIDMTRDIRDRLTQFILTDDAGGYDADFDYSHDGSPDVDDGWVNMAERYGMWDGDDLATAFEVRRIALNMDQVLQYNPPPNPAKITDSRAPDYIEKYGRQSWELDALDPRTLTNLIDTHIAREVNMDLLEARRAQDESDRDRLKELANVPWDQITSWLDGR